MVAALRDILKELNRYREQAGEVSENTKRIDALEAEIAELRACLDAK